MEAWPILKDDTRPTMMTYITGNHVVTCLTCGSHFVGHELSIECADCAYGWREGRYLSKASRRRER